VTGPDRQEGATGGGGTRSLTADAIARLVRGTLAGDGAATVSGVAPLDRASDADLSFLANGKYAEAALASCAPVLLVSPDLAGVPTRARATIVVPRPHEALLAILPRFYETALPAGHGVHPTARVGRHVTLGEAVAIGPYAVIGDGADLGDRVVVESHAVVGARARIGADSILWPAVVIYPDAQLGNRVLVHAGARVGCDGFGYVPDDGGHRKIPHVGRCVVEDDVEIGANTTIDRGSIDDTVIGQGTKIDNLVHVGHNVRIGRRCLIMAQVGIAGSARVEDDVILAGQVGLSGHLTVGKGARLGAQAGVFGDVPGGETWSGYPARPHRESLRASAALFKLAGMMKRLERMLDGGG
jgi:UDP-3-O-[3-hydroxymyristoyl] glucosamine N-acyltransferase